MAQRKPLIAANLKMNSLPVGLLEKDSAYHCTTTVDTLVFPTNLDLQACIQAGITTGAQAARAENCGAHTGDISMKMIKVLGCTNVLCGHSERRKDHHESNEDIVKQVNSALLNGLIPILCIGETEQERKEGLTETVLYLQLQHLPLEQVSIIAYEPVWAIGTGNSATPEQAEAMHAFIRSKLPEATKNTTRILYGGSMKPDNAKELLMQLNIDGGLIGGSALDPIAFGEIVTIAENIKV